MSATIVPHMASPSRTLGPRHGQLAHTGKVERLIVDRLGDSEGFVWRTDHRAERQFGSRGEHLAGLVRWAWQARIRMAVYAEEHQPYIAIRLDMHA